MPVNGLVTMTPTSVAKTGASSTATINTNGSVTFSTCTTLSLNGVFTADYDNYFVNIRCLSTELSAAFQFRLRANGTDNSTTSSYASQFLNVTSTTISPSRITDNYGRFSTTSSTQRDGYSIYLFGPKLAQATAWRLTSANGVSSATVSDSAGTHNQSTAYDGLTIYPFIGSISGLIAVYGFNQ